MRERVSTPPTLLVDLTLPSMKLALGPLSFDPVRQMLGVDPGDSLQPLLRGEPFVRTVSGANVEVFPLAIAPGVQLAVPLGAYGELAVANDRGLLALTVPAMAGRWLAHQAGALLVAGPTPGVGYDGLRSVATVWLRLVPGARAGIPLGAFGEMGLEAA